jgi:hypothetical protein
VVERLESVLHPQVRKELVRRDKASMTDFEPWRPRRQLDIRAPQRADQDKTFLRPCQALRATERVAGKPGFELRGAPVGIQTDAASLSMGSNW